jgi:IS5 family transposase
VIDQCNKIAEEEGIEQHRRYMRESRQLLRDACNGTPPKRAKKAKKAKKRLKTIAGRQIREQRKRYEKELGVYKRAVNQRKEDKGKVYSLHKPFTHCISKGKPHKPYEFGNEENHNRHTGISEWNRITSWAKKGYKSTLYWLLRLGI